MSCKVLWRIAEDNIALQIQGLLSWCLCTKTVPLISWGLVILKTPHGVLLYVVKVSVEVRNSYLEVKEL